MLKPIIGGIVGLGLALWGDITLGSWLLGMVPDGDWSGLVRVGIVIVLIWLTGGVVVLSAWLGALAGALIDAFQE